ncbi:MAG: hypothetical protein NC039_05385 [Muribaculaceae bacterium]|nr:hypothetical protein [Muribaculaceae bacterium]
MKKLFYLLFLLPLLGIMAACDDDDDKSLPKVNITIQYSGAVEQDGAITIAQGKVLTIEAINVTPIDGTKKAVLGNTTYMMDGIPFYTTGLAPYGAEISTENLAVGTHTLSFYSQVFQEDKTPGFAICEYPLVITAPADDPGDGGGTVTPDVRISDHQE